MSSSVIAEAIHSAPDGRPGRSAVTRPRRRAAALRSQYWSRSNPRTTIRTIIRGDAAAIRRGGYRALRLGRGQSIARASAHQPRRPARSRARSLPRGPRRAAARGPAGSAGCARRTRRRSKLRNLADPSSIFSGMPPTLPRRSGAPSPAPRSRSARSPRASTSAGTTSAYDWNA